MENNTASQFLTQDLGFACFLHAAHKLKFVGCKDADNGKVNFMFNDANGDGETHRGSYPGGGEMRLGVDGVDVALVAEEDLRDDIGYGNRR